MAPDIRTPAEPIDDHRCKFVVSEPLFSAGVRRCPGRAGAKGPPAGEAASATSQRRACRVRGGLVRAPARPRVARAAPALPPAPKPAGEDVGDAALYEQVAKLFD